MELCGKHALVTGASNRIGRAIALGLAAAGANIILHYNESEEEVRISLAQVQNKGVHAESIAADFTNTKEIYSFIEYIRKQYKTLDILVNNASIFTRGRLSHTTYNQWDTHMDVNLRAPFLLSKELKGIMDSSKPGKIINMLDWRIERPDIEYASYTVSKIALAGLTKLLAKEYSPHILVNGIALGYILPPAGASFEMLQHSAEGISTGKAGSVKSVVDTVLFILGNDHVNGEIIYVDGGAHNA